TGSSSPSSRSTSPRPSTSWSPPRARHARRAARTPRLLRDEPDEAGVSSDRAALRAQALAAVAAAREPAELARVEREVLGQRGAVGKLLAGIRDVPPAERRAFGEAANELKQAIEAALAGRRDALERERLAAERSAQPFDATLPAPRAERGSLHPVT